MTLFLLDSFRKTENADPLNRWIGNTYFQNPFPTSSIKV